MKDEDDKHILLWGMSGSGKSTVGPDLARRLSRPFLDLDRLIEDAEGMSIPELFDQAGESLFREIERRILRSVLAAQSPMVLALGGGSLLDESSRAKARQRANVITLTANLHTLIARLETTKDRPLLRRGSKEESVARLLHARADAYADVDDQIDTTGLTPSEVAECIELRLGCGSPLETESDVSSVLEIHK